jgi:hypothetical protein
MALTPGPWLVTRCDVTSWSEERKAWKRESLKLPFESLTERKEKLRQAGETTGHAEGTD